MLTHTQRANFKRILMQLMKAKTDAKILKIITQANNYLTEYDIDWDAISLTIPGNYVYRSEKRRRPGPKPLTTTAAEKASGALNGKGHLGLDGRALLRKAIIKHPDYPTVRETLDVDISTVTIEDLIAIAQLLKIDDQFIKLFVEPITTPADNGAGEEDHPNE